MAFSDPLFVGGTSNRVVNSQTWAALRLSRRAADVAAEDDLAQLTCGGESFNRTTRVLLADGRSEPIARLRPGDKVLATNTKTGKTQAETVTAVLVRRDTNPYDLKIRDNDATSVIHTTSSHLFRISVGRHREGWVKAGALRYGTHLCTLFGGATVLGGWTLKDTAQWMWDLTVPGNNDHDFYIGTAVGDVLVHNAGGICPNQVGQAGENAVRGSYDIGPKVSKVIDGRTRIFDGLNDTAVSEVKNTGYQAYTQQLKDSLTYAQENGLQFNLYVRGGSNPTVLSGPLLDAISNTPGFNLRIIP